VAAIEPIKVTGLKEFRRNLKTISSDLPKCIRLANNEVADVVVLWVKGRMENRTGGAVSTVKAASTQKEVRVKEGSAKRPYVPWLDFGGCVGPKRSVKRQFYSDGRYLYPALLANRDLMTEKLTEQLIALCHRAGVDVTS
jgi:hypothetical protein